jgi:small subunit ribosomal protein S6
MAYPIQNHTEGYYVVNHLRLAPARSEELERLLKISDDVIRHILVRQDI